MTILGSRLNSYQKSGVFALKKRLFKLKFPKSIIDMTTEHSNCNVILNFQNIGIITSSSLTRLLMGCQMVLCNIHPFTKSAFEVFTLAADKLVAVVVLSSNLFVRQAICRLGTKRP